MYLSIIPAKGMVFLLKICSRNRLTDLCLFMDRKFSHLTCAVHHGIRDLCAAQNSCKLLHRLFLIQSVDRCGRMRILIIFFDQIMRICHSRDLRKVLYTDHLMTSTNERHFFCDFLCRSAADSYINFIKDQCTDFIMFRQYRLNC